ncbi:hypothetical protein U3516DRAFT_788073 [Neocallimastix sp. 'constans']
MSSTNQQSNNINLAHFIVNTYALIIATNSIYTADIEDNIVIYGFGYSEDHTQVRLAITDFVPYKYSRMIHKDFSYKSEQKYVLREYDKGIQKLYKHYFTNAQEYNLNNSIKIEFLPSKQTTCQGSFDS